MSKKESKTKESHGGYRANAGRKKANHTLLAEEMRKYIIERVAKEQGPLMDALIERAKSGSDKAMDILFERVLGRPTTPMSFEGEGFAELTKMVGAILSGPRKENQNGNIKK